MWAVVFLRLLQVVIWKRVVEINENLISKVTKRTFFVLWLSLAMMCHPEDKVFGAISVFKGSSPVQLPLAACKEGIDPLHQK